MPVNPVDRAPSPVVFVDDAGRQHAETLFVSLFKQLDGSDSLSRPFHRVELIRLMHRFSCTQPSKDPFLQRFFSSIRIDMAESPAAVVIGPVPQLAIEFTDDLITNFFIPVRLTLSSCLLSCIYVCVLLLMQPLSLIVNFRLLSSLLVNAQLTLAALHSRSFIRERAAVNTHNTVCPKFSSRSGPPRVNNPASNITTRLLNPRQAPLYNIEKVRQVRGIETD